MFGFLRSLFKARHPVKQAARSKDAAQLHQALLDSDVVVIHAELGEGLPLDANEDAVLKVIEKASRVEPADPCFFTYEDEGKIHFPFFLTPSDAQRFCGAYSSRENTLYAYQLFQVPGSVILQGSRPYDVLLMNAQGDDEFKSSSEFLSALRKLPSPTESGITMKRLSVAIPHPYLRF